MLKGLSPLISPDLMTTMMRMGHGDDLVLADANFPGESHARRMVRADGIGIPELLDAILPWFPLDTFVACPAFVMQPVDVAASEPPVWSEYRRLLSQHERRPIGLACVERFAFYEQARASYAVVATGELSIYGNLVLRKGVVFPGLK